jgi:hypothetical protein
VLTRWIPLLVGDKRMGASEPNETCDVVEATRSSCMGISRRLPLGGVGALMARSS